MTGDKNVIDPLQEEQEENARHLSRIKELLDKEDNDGISVLVNDMEPEDVAGILGEFSVEDKITIFNTTNSLL